MAGALCSIDDVCVVTTVCGAAADTTANPDLLLEVPHAATRARHFDRLRGQLQGDYDEGLRDFFFVNTDVGAPELAHAVAAGFVAADPRRTAVVVTSEIPRTFVDCNRSIDRDAVATASKAGGMTPGLPPWVVDEGDRELLLDRYFAYRAVVAA
ncbi:MAG TPA: hypothetical protein ENI87_13825, partial [bacterium]|nr:hypothetical protein [bacterium]